MRSIWPYKHSEKQKYGSFQCSLIGVLSIDDILSRAEPKGFGKEPELSTDEAIRSFRSITQRPAPEISATRTVAARPQISVISTVNLGMGTLTMNCQNNLARRSLWLAKFLLMGAALSQSSFLGGLRAFGSLGVFLGPVILAAALALLSFVREESRRPALRAEWNHRRVGQF
jgi:hypothetical protein